ncbi:hypothetical protein BDZ85DRAFT_266572 [Elsinoe ampelina]|uniref:Uncharacterized protein n=1 Tax=Elsinoe ampelina TaxID=302913 RepID=A0A6A6G498_9PEZI|nr:hypothetical protein BDZ85DRAFT_266572 [Elsinoe ampelina]
MWNQVWCGAAARMIQSPTRPVSGSPWEGSDHMQLRWWHSRWSLCMAWLAHFVVRQTILSAALVVNRRGRICSEGKTELSCHIALSSRDAPIRYVLRLACS